MIYGLDKYSASGAAVHANTDLPVVDASSASVDAAPEGVVDASLDSGADAPVDMAMEAGPEACAQPGCSTAVCVPFDNASRIRGYVVDAALPPLAEAGSAVPEAGSAADAGDAGSVAAAEAGTGSLPLCSTLPAPVIVIGSTGLSSLAAELGQLTATYPMTVVFAAARSCDGAKAIIEDKSAFDLGLTTATYWDVTGAAHTCALDEASAYADIGLGQLFADACLTLPQGTPGIADFLGPVTPFDIVVPTTSTQAAISAEALYYTVGIGNGDVSPWTNPSLVFYNPGSGPQTDLSLALGVPSGQWKGTTVATAPQNIAKVGTSSDPEATLGMIGTELVESPSNTSTIKAMAYQDMGQSCGYYPNATATSADKTNVRDGHYPLWGFSHMLAKVNLQNVPLNPTAAALVSFFTGNQPTPEGDFLRFVINDHLVPVCAMRVIRQTEMGPLLPFTPSPSCGCYFDSLTQGSSTCAVCTSDSDCAASTPHCNLGFCEVN
jgi:hypothetical protein